MPLKINRPAPRTAKQKALTQALVAELRGPHETGQPIITERHMPRNGAVHVQVLWDRWEECPIEKRWELIYDAYREVKGPELAEQILLATGLTLSEATRLGFLPFQVLPRVKGTNHLSPEEHDRAMIEEGAFRLDGANRPTLRFESLAEAEACEERLEQRLPGSRWSIVQHDSCPQ